MSTDLTSDTYNTLITVFEIIAVTSYALAGAIGGAKDGCDVVGMTVFALMQACGGGTIRDLIIYQPVFWASDALYIYISLGAMLVIYTYTLFRPAKHFPSNYLMYVEAIGLGSFAVIGTSKTIRSGFPFITAVFMGVLTGTGGGLMRDTLSGRIPTIFQADIICLSSFAGCMMFAIVVSTVDEISDGWYIALTVCTIFLIALTRIFGTIYSEYLPRPRRYLRMFLHKYNLADWTENYNIQIPEKCESPDLQSDSPPNEYATSGEAIDITNGEYSRQASGSNSVKQSHVGGESYIVERCISQQSHGTNRSSVINNVSGIADHDAWVKKMMQKIKHPSQSSIDTEDDFSRQVSFMGAQEALRRRSTRLSHLTHARESLTHHPRVSHRASQPLQPEHRGSQHQKINSGADTPRVEDGRYGPSTSRGDMHIARNASVKTYCGGTISFGDSESGDHKSVHTTHSDHHDYDPAYRSRKSTSGISHHHTPTNSPPTHTHAVSALKQPATSPNLNDTKHKSIRTPPHAHVEIGERHVISDGQSIDYTHFAKARSDSSGVSFSDTIAVPAPHLSPVTSANFAEDARRMDRDANEATEHHHNTEMPVSGPPPQTSEAHADSSQRSFGDMLSANLSHVSDPRTIDVQTQAGNQAHDHHALTRTPQSPRPHPPLRAHPHTLQHSVSYTHEQDQQQSP